MHKSRGVDAAPGFCLSSSDDTHSDTGIVPLDCKQHHTGQRDSRPSVSEAPLATTSLKAMIN
jgi:hypothetical protein